MNGYADRTHKPGSESTGRRGCGDCNDDVRAARAERKGAASERSALDAIQKTPGEAIAADIRGHMNAQFNYDFSRVRVHSDAASQDSVRRQQANAFTIGHHVVMDGGTGAGDGARDPWILAHELTHVIQQSAGPPAGYVSANTLEAEAHAAADAVARGDNVHITGRAANATQRQGRGATRPAPQARPPTVGQLRVITAARRAAAIRTQRALLLVSGVVPPSPHEFGDAAAEAQMRATSLARRMFEWADPNMEQVREVVSSMVTALTSGTQAQVAAGNDPECGNRAAYVRGLRPPMVLCPAFFSSSAEQQIRTMVHEAAHIARIGSAGLGESYCGVFDCQTSCGGFDSADSWAHFVHCLSDQVPDRPIVIQGQQRPAPGGTGGQSGPKP